MERYKDWSPTQFDSKGLGCEDRQDWYVGPVLQTRDSGCLEKSNFETFEKIMEENDTENCDFEWHSFNHWGPGYFDIFLIRPDSACYYAAIEAEKALEDYPILDEMDFSEKEHEDMLESWQSWACSDFEREVCNNLELSEDLEERFENASHDQMLELYSLACEKNGIQDFEHSDEGCHFQVEEAAKFVDMISLKEFVRRIENGESIR